jgi:hypothetical protein
MHRRSDKRQFQSRPVPTALRSGPYRLFFYAGDRDEPPHVHIERDDRIAKFWLDPIRLQRGGGFSRVEITRIERLVGDRQVELMEVWNEYFGH